MTGETCRRRQGQGRSVSCGRVVPHDATYRRCATKLAERLMKGAPLAQRAMKEMAMRAPHLTSSEAIGWVRPCARRQLKRGLSRGADGGRRTPAAPLAGQVARLPATRTGQVQPPLPRPLDTLAPRSGRPGASTRPPSF